MERRLGGTPRWVAGVPTEEGTAWVAVLEDGRARAFTLTPDGLEPARVTPRRLPPGAPPLLVSRRDSRETSLELVVAQAAPGSELTHPVPLSPDGDPAGLLVIGEDGALSVQQDGQSLGIPGAPAALPDARAVRGPEGEIALLTGPTRRYDHGVLGDGLEAATMTVLRPTGDGARVLASFPAASGGVFESLAPLWFEQDGERLLAVTESVAGIGSRISVYRPSGELASAGPFVGEAQRWRHLTAAAPFGPDGETELSATLTPHMQSFAQFYSLDEGLDIVAEAPGYTSHRIYSRNLDSVLAGDLDADGEAELLMPTPSYTELGAISRAPGRVTEIRWELPLGGELSTNLTAATGPDGTVVAAGRSDGVLRLWR